MNVVYLKPAEMHVTDLPTLVVTVLGSCLSVTMYNRRKKLGGICHGLLPRCPSQTTCAQGCTESFKFVDCSIRHMVKQFDQRGVSRSEIEVKCFGAANMFSRNDKTTGIDSMGRQNVQTAEEIILSEGLSILRMDVGGLQGRKILFYTDTGEVFLKRLTNVKTPDIRW
jgi:chemotaxis protein CheD